MVKKWVLREWGFGLLWDRIGVAPEKNGKKWEEYKNWVKILSDWYKRAILVGKKWKMG